jgi:hypothetical protein
MKLSSFFTGALVVTLVILAGCVNTASPQAHPSPSATTTVTPAVAHDDAGPGLQEPAKSAKEIRYADPVLGNASAIPVILSGTDWEMAAGCGWTEANLTESAALLLSNCEARQLIRDGGRVVGIGYDMNMLGNRCRISTHPDANASCSWCLDAGPTLSIDYHGMIVQYIAHLNTRTVTGYSASLPDGARSESSGGKEIIRFANGTVFYTFGQGADAGTCPV